MRKSVLIINLYTIRRKCHMIAESAQPRNPSNVLSRVVGGVWGRDCTSARMAQPRPPHNLPRAPRLRLQRAYY